ncbi:hypothetical protein BHF71_07725 [Vulcanibacillus modesticaldus]|uniref:Flagellar Assembly Protein A N-terminal region domain-containing protein n=1 Tax=Vulcanibacillus modesticaldus TaxID=337097 RepID=A0A1D2YVM1_9BACI|nr:FapA family protein [Vulcanibacillus modesticaldus]OEF99707.1 hypothetical protein BHF71_07725 [Vulcanibacillus modesticaldus]
MVKSLGIEELSKMVLVSITDSGLAATLKFNTMEFDDEWISYESMKSFLEEQNVVFGVDEKLLAEICSNPKNYLKKEIVIARGTAPVNGQDGYIVWEVNKDQTKKPKVLGDGSVDFYSINGVTNLKKGQLIARRIAATEGVPGKSVTGKEIPAKNGKNVYCKLGKNVVINDTKDRVYSAIDGQLVITEKEKINVFPIYEINGDVDLSIGNIDFVGSVVIRGNVLDGFKIRADGDIKVYGNVEGAELIAGGDIYVKQGVLGHKKSYIKTHKNFQASFILDGDVHAGEDVIVSTSIMHSNVSAGKRIICKGSKGIIVGGKVQAGDSVTADVVGNELATSTIVEVGIDPELRKELNEILSEKKELGNSLDKVTKGMRLLEQMEKMGKTLPPDRKMLKIKLIDQKLVIERRVKEIASREKEIQEQIDKFDHAYIEILNTVYPGTKLILGNVAKFIIKNHQRVKFVLEDGVISTKILR